MEDIYSEHLEELSIIFDQHLESLQNQGPGVLDDETEQERREMHLDALIIGGEPTLELCRTQGKQGDPGELYATVCVFCRQDLQEEVKELLAGLDYNAEDRVTAVTEALCHEWPAGWEDTLLPWMQEQVEEIPGLKQAINKLKYRQTKSREDTD